MATIGKDDRHPKFYMVRWITVDENGETVRHKKRDIRTLKEAKAFVYQLEKEKEKADAEAANGQSDLAPTGDPGNMIFDELVDKWLDFESRRVKESSLMSLRSKVYQQILPYFTGKTIKEITPLMVLRWQDQLADKLSYQYANTIRARLISIYRFGNKYYYIPNVMDHVDGLRNLEAKKEMQIWTPEQFAQFAEHCHNDQYRLFFTCLYIFGCRKGELQALQWQDIDFKKCDVHICHTYTNKVKDETWTITTPKTKTSDRHIKIPKDLCEKLKDLKVESVYAGPQNFVFGGERPLAPQSILWWFEKGTKEAELPRIRVHDLRHSCASWLISEGVDIVTISRRLGHSSVNQTLDTYSHMMPSAEDKAVNVLGSLGV